MDFPNLERVKKNNQNIKMHVTSSQAPSYASPNLSATEWLTRVKCRATSVAKKATLHVYNGIYSVKPNGGPPGGGLDQHRHKVFRRCCWLCKLRFCLVRKVHRGEGWSRSVNRGPDNWCTVRRIKTSWLSFVWLVGSCRQACGLMKFMKSFFQYPLVNPLDSYQNNSPTWLSHP